MDSFSTPDTLNVNTLTIIALVYWAFAALWACYRGIIRTMLSFLVLILTVVITYMGTPKLYQSFRGSANVNNYIQTKSSGIIENFADSIASGTGGSELLEVLPLPEDIQSVVSLGDNAMIAQVLRSDAVKGVLSIQLSNFILRIGATVVMALVTFIVLSVIRFILLRIADFPGISGIDHFLGLLLGLVKGVVVIWIALLIIRLVALTGYGTGLLAQIGESEILSTLDYYNMVRRLISSLIAGM